VDALRSMNFGLQPRTAKILRTHWSNAVTLIGIGLPMRADLSPGMTGELHSGQGKPSDE